MILPAVGRHETRTGEKPMELITLSQHSAIRIVPGSGDVVRTERIYDAGFAGTLAAAGVTACSCIQREVHLLGRGCGSLFLYESS